jgi:hypothetical protein
MFNAAAANKIERPSPQEIAERKRIGGDPVAAHVRASVYLQGLNDARTNNPNADFRAAVIDMQNAARVGGQIEQPNADQVVEYERLRVAGIARTADYINTSVYLQFGGAARAAIIPNPNERDLVACMYVYNDPDNWGIKNNQPKRPVILAVKRLQELALVTPAMMAKDNVWPTSFLQANSPHGGPVGIPQPAPDQILALADNHLDVDMRKLVGWKIKKQVAAASPDIIPGAIAKFIRANDGAGHAEFEIIETTNGGLGSARVAGNIIKVDPAALPGLPNGAGGVVGPAGPAADQLFTLWDIQDDVADPSNTRVTLDQPDRQP